MSERLAFKVVIVGNGGVGKTSLIRRFVHDKFEKDYLLTIGTDVTKYSDQIEGNDITFIIWDLGGQEAFAEMRNKFFYGANAAIVVFSHEENEIGDTSFTSIPKWLGDISKFCGKIPTILFGNKIDLVDSEMLWSNDEHPRSDHALKKLASDLGLLGYFKTSALSGKNVLTAFKTLMSKLYEFYKEQQNRPKRKMSF